MSKALRSAADFPNLPVPLWLRNAPTKLMRDLGYGNDYEWQPGFMPEQGFFPEQLSGTDFFK
jgi:putative ATPase